MSNRPKIYSRRTVLGNATQAALLAGAGSALQQISFPGTALAQEAGDYRAIVCIFLIGGYDNWSGVPPIDATSYSQYAAARPDLALPGNLLNSTALRPRNQLGGYAYALHPQLAPLIEIFDAGDLALIQNVGALVEPTSKARYEAGSARLPPQLFSHNDQSSYVLSSLLEGGVTGWGGRIADAVSYLNSRPAFSCINSGSYSIFQYGAATRPYAVGNNGASKLGNFAQSWGGSSLATDYLAAVASIRGTNIFRNEYANYMGRALQSSSLMNQAFATVTAEQIPELSDESNPLAVQLRSVARAIAGGRAQGMRRQVFYASFGNWDTHSSGTSVDLAANFAKLGYALKGFWQVLNRWGLSDSVTSFTASDFGRTLVSNGGGSDHGWGSTHFVMGGAVDGGKIFGRPPVVGLTSQDVLSGGRLIPTSSFDQVAATLARWMGVPPTDLLRIAPNLINFPPNQWDLGFLPA